MIIKQEWDSSVLGIECFLIDNSQMDLVNKISECMEFLSDSGPKRFTTIKITGDMPGFIQPFVKAGARFIDTELTFSLTYNHHNPVPNKICHVKFINKTNPDDFLKMSEEFSWSRFFLDHKFPKKKAKKLWEESIKNHCEGYGDKIAIAIVDQHPAGFVFLGENDSSVTLKTVGVLKEYRGLKIARSMITAIVDYYGSSFRFLVETSMLNAAAVFSYQEAGFRLKETTYILHHGHF